TGPPANISDVPDGKNYLEDAVFSPDGASVLARSVFDSKAWLWDTSTGSLRRSFEAGSAVLNVASFSPDGTRLLTASSPPDVRVWDVATGREILKLDLGLKNPFGILSVALFSPDGTRILTGVGGATAQLWDATTGKALASFVSDSFDIKSLDRAAFSPDGKRILTSVRPLAKWPPDSNPDQTSTPRLFDAVTGRELMRLEGHKQEITGLAFSPDGTRILTTSYDKTARIWDANTGQELVRLDGHREPVTRAAFSPNGDRVVTICEDNTARLWEVSSGREIARFFGHDKRLNTAAFSSDGRFVVTSSTDKTAQIWDAFIETQELVDIAKNTVQRCLTENER